MCYTAAFNTQISLPEKTKESDVRYSSSRVRRNQLMQRNCHSSSTALYYQNKKNNKERLEDYLQNYKPLKMDCI